MWRMRKSSLLGAVLCGFVGVQAGGIDNKNISNRKAENLHLEKWMGANIDELRETVMR